MKSLYHVRTINTNEARHKRRIIIRRRRWALFWRSRNNLPVDLDSCEPCAHARSGRHRFHGAFKCDEIHAAPVSIGCHGRSRTKCVRIARRNPLPFRPPGTTTVSPSESRNRNRYTISNPLSRQRGQQCHSEGFCPISQIKSPGILIEMRYFGQQQLCWKTHCRLRGRYSHSDRKGHRCAGTCPGNSV